MKTWLVVVMAMLVPSVLFGESAKAGKPVEVKAIAKPGSPAEAVYVTTYAVHHLPVWQKTDKGDVRFDASILIALVKAEVAPETWGKSGDIASFDANHLIVVRQTLANHKRIAAVLDKLGRHE